MTRSVQVAILLGTACAAFFAGFFVARATKSTPAPEASTARAQAPRALRVRLEDGLARRANVIASPARRTDLQPALELLGSVDFDSEHVADIGSRVSGRLTSVLVGLGEEVTAGQAVVLIEGPEIGDAIANLLSARASLVAATAHASREQALGAEHLTNASSVEQSRAHAAALQAEARGAEQRLLALGLSHGEIQALIAGRGLRQITLRSPIAGEVVTRNAYLGQVVDPTHVVLRVADLDTVWVMLDVYERDLGRVHIGDSAEIRSETHPNDVFRGRVGHIDATVDVRTRTARVRIEVANDGRLLRPGQFVRARVLTYGESRQAVCVKRSAVTQYDGSPSVFVQVGRGEYELRPIEIGTSVGDEIEVVRGVVADDVVVTEGVFALKSELLR